LKITTVGFIMNHKAKTDNLPLVVDLDGTLINIDLLYTGFISLIKKNLLFIVISPFWLFNGRAYFKRKIFEIIDIKPELLPYNSDLLHFLIEQHKNGRKLILATASPIKVAMKISRHQKIFNEVYGTEGNTNLKGNKKLELLNSNYGERNFDYIGNSNDDLIIFASARYSYLVNPKKSLERKTREVSDLKFIFYH